MKIQLIDKNIPWDHNYNDVPRWGGENELRNYIGYSENKWFDTTANISNFISETEFSVKIQLDNSLTTKIKDRVNINLLSYNYLLIEIDFKIIYCFIKTATLSANRTIIYDVEVDIFTTYHTLWEKIDEVSVNVKSGHLRRFKNHVQTNTTLSMEYNDSDLINTFEQNFKVADLIKETTPLQLNYKLFGGDKIEDRPIQTPNQVNGVGINFYDECGRMFTADLSNILFSFTDNRAGQSTQSIKPYIEVFGFTPTVNRTSNVTIKVFLNNNATPIVFSWVSSEAMDVKIQQMSNFFKLVWDNAFSSLRKTLKETWWMKFYFIQKNINNQIQNNIMKNVFVDKQRLEYGVSWFPINNNNISYIFTKDNITLNNLKGQDISDKSWLMDKNYVSYAEEIYRHIYDNDFADVESLNVYLSKYPNEEMIYLLLVKSMFCNMIDVIYTGTGNNDVYDVTLWSIDKYKENNPNVKPWCWYVKTTQQVIQDKKLSTLYFFRSDLSNKFGNTTYLNSLPISKKPNDIAYINRFEIPYDYKYETKIYHYPFNFYRIGTMNDQGKLLVPQFLGYKGIDFKYIDAFNMSINVDTVTIEPCDKTTSSISNNYWDPLKQNLVTNLTYDTNIPLSKDALTEFIKTQNNQFRVGLLNTTVQGGIGLLTGALSSFAIGNILPMIVQSGSFASNMIRQQNMMDAKLSDLKNTPDETRNYSNVIKLISHEKGLNVYKYGMNESDLKVIADHFHLYGYTINRVIKLKEVILSRINFTYIQIDDYLSTHVKHLYTDKTLSTSTWNKIDKIFRNGVTIWHYKDFNNSWLNFDTIVV